MVWGGSGVVKGWGKDFVDSMHIDTPPPDTLLKDNASCGPMTICHTGSSICTDVIKQTDVHSHWVYDRLTAVHQLWLISFVWNTLLNKHSSIKLWFSSAFKLQCLSLSLCRFFKIKCVAQLDWFSIKKTVAANFFLMSLCSWFTLKGNRSGKTLS